MEKLITDYFAKIGALGGKSGTGAAKRRDAEHYKKMVEARNKKRQEAKNESV